MSPRLEDEKEFKELVIGFHEGRVSRAQLAKAIHRHSTSISLDSLVSSLQQLFPDAGITSRQAEVRVDLLQATQISNDRSKYELVCLLFDDESTYDAYEREFFAEHPVTVLHVGGGHYAILDGHHRVRRFAELTGGSRPMKVMLIHTDSQELILRFRMEIEDVRRAAGTVNVSEIPLV